MMSANVVKILVVHNNERDRLAYLTPRLRHLIEGLKAAGTGASLQLVGPDVDLIAENRFDDDFPNRLRRAIEASSMFYSAAVDNPRLTWRHKRLLQYARHFAVHLMRYRRSIRIEQEVLYAHAFCWRESVRAGEQAIVLESDAIVHEHTLAGLLAILKYLQSSCASTARHYVDLAGGCDRDRTLSSWCFKNEYGCKDIEMSVGGRKLILHKLPRLTPNTVGGYLISPALAADLLTFVQDTRPMLPPDWALNRFAARGRDADVLCIHTSPTLFSQGSSVGAYRSTIGRARWEREIQA